MDQLDIDERPKEVDKNTRLGDGELDTIIGRAQSGAIVSMVERRSTRTQLAIPPGQTAGGVKAALS